MRNVFENLDAVRLVERARLNALALNEVVRDILKELGYDEPQPDQIRRMALDLIDAAIAQQIRNLIDRGGFKAEKASEIGECFRDWLEAHIDQPFEKKEQN